MDNADKPAYPTKIVREPNGSRNSLPDNVNGLTKRERFAMAAMQGLIAWDGINYEEDEVRIAESSVEMADALLNELNQ